MSLPLYRTTGVVDVVVVGGGDVGVLERRSSPYHPVTNSKGH